MSQTTNGKFNYRAFISVLSGFTFLAMAVTGLVIFFAPSCRIARDTDWSVWGFAKEQWTAVHVWFSLAFVIAAALHIYLNWACLITYFRNKLREGFALRTEWVLALAICAVIGLGTVYEVTPFSSLAAYQGTFKHSEGGLGAGGQGWRGGRGAMQPGQNYFASPTGAITGSASGKACEQGKTGSCETATKSCGAEGACENASEPASVTQEEAQVIACAETQMQGPAASAVGFGIGRQTLKQFCAEQGIDLASVISVLKSRGFDAGGSMTMRQIADSAGVHPRELRALLVSQ